MDHEKQSLIDESPASPSTTKFVVVVALLAACAGFAAGAVVHSPTLVNKSASFETEDQCAYDKAELEDKINRAAICFFRADKINRQRFAFSELRKQMKQLEQMVENFEKGL
mmetsp:Transcript_25257/g.75839  ORF Transcript_25257/g.75839 Transcript_25257/m.75839 type:complete len:111 (+) Transcript_25257:68-400(+)